MGANEKEIKVSDFVADWKATFTERIKDLSNSRKQDFTFADALKRCTTSRNELDKLMIEYLNFINSNPLRNNDYFKYVNSYKKGKKLNEKYFRHDINKLQEYYEKSDKDMEYNPFNEYQYKKYVLFMMLKFSDLYLTEYDAMFNVKIDKSREYNPLTSIPSVLRQYLPFEIKEYDIAQAYPSFIFLELGIKPFDVYKLIDKRKFNMLLNIHKGVKGATIEAVRSQLEPIYKERVNEVITEERFNTKGRLFEDLAKYEAEYIQKFVDTNKPKYFVRLHDGVTTLKDAECKELEFGIVKFKVKEFLKPEQLSDIVSFYCINEEGKPTTSPVTYSRFFEQEDFIRITREGHDQLTILKNENRIVTPINHKTDLVPFLKENINEFDSAPLEDRIARDATGTIQQSLQLLTPIPLQYHRDTKARCDIPFKNGIARITADGTELIPYDDINGFFSKHSTQEHEISFCDANEKPSDFYQFLMMAVTNKDIQKEDLTNEDIRSVSAFCTMFGYLITNYKNPAFNPAIILSDEGADGESRNGGRGKSLLQMALSHFRPSIQKGGNAYDPTYTHVHADLKKEHDLYLLDDVPSNFNYNALYTHITGSIDAQRKGVTAETISFEDAPKFVISTNWAVRYEAEATSTNRRFKEYKFSDFWNINNTPDAYFKKSFFTDWDQDEWNAFYNFGFFCVQSFLNNGLLSIEYDKRMDNFRAYFYNDGILNEVERIFETLIFEKTEVFGVADFVEIHKRNDMYRYKPEFSIHNSRKYIDAFIEHNKKPFSYCGHLRKYKAFD
ncbi:MAG: hypothetical protein ACTIJ9_10035 [Aequorivita sp.]